MKYLQLLLTLTGLAIGQLLLAQPGQLSIAARGTGRTTGHIADLTITNRSDDPTILAAGLFYIPGSNRYQSYVGRVPTEAIIAPGQTVNVPVQGYCTDIHTPPVPAGVAMPNFRDWILVTDDPALPVTSEPTVPEPMNPPGSGGSTSMATVLRPDRILPTFVPNDIPDIIRSPGYRATTKETEQPATGIVVTYPGTDIPVGGTITVDEDPARYAPLVANIVQRIEEAATLIQLDPNMSTPFAGTPPREREALIQQTVWIVTAALTGEEYTRDDFAHNTYQQFTEATGQPVASLEEPAREQLDQGVADFWNAFTAVGLEAKVISEGGSGSATDVQYQQAAPLPKCKCEKIEFDVAVYRGGILRDEESSVEAKSSNTNTVELEVDDLDNEQEYEISISNIEVFCTCKDAPAEDNRCHVYPPVNSSNKKHEDFTNSDRTRDGTSHDQVGIHIANDEDDAVRHNANGSQSDAAWTDDTRTTFQFTFTTDKKGQFEEASQSFEITGRCESDDCGGEQRVRICDRFVRIKLKETKE